MNYTADLHLDELVNGDYRTKDAFDNAFGEFHFTPEGAEPTVESTSKACSGFVCKSPQGGLLLGRNFDGAHGPMLLVFNSTNGYKYIQFTAPDYNSVLYQGTNGHNGDGLLSDGKTSLHRLMRVAHMMNYYKPTMTEKEAMLCLQEGRYSIEVPNDFTNWSCVYNPKQLTVNFALRNDLSQVYTVDLKEVFK